MRTHERRLGAAALLLALGLGGCDAGLTEVNRNPNAPEDVPIENVLLSGIWDVMANAGNRGMFGNWTQLYHASNWAQHLAQPVYNDEDRYTPRAGIPTNIWDEMYTSLTDLEHVKEHAAAEGLDNMWAVAEIMQVNGFMLLTDYFGDIPYFEALSLDEDIQFPAYTPQAEVYPDLIARLAAAAALIDTDAAVSFEAFDPVYQGDMQGWLEFANSLQLRLAMRLSDTSLATEAEAAFAAAWGADVFDDAGDIADADWSAAQPAQNPLYEGIVLAGRSGDFRLSSSLVDRMAALNDPRLPIYAEPALSDGAYRGLRNGLTPADYTFGTATGTVSDFSVIGSAFLQPTTPSVLMSTAEVLFLAAEAAERGWITGDPATLYADAIEASMQQHGVAQAAIDAYLAQPAVAYTGVDDIHLQKWIALYLAGPEAFAEMRRVGRLDLVPAANSVLDAGVFPARLYYPPEEGRYNPENYVQLEIDVPVWWMTGD